MKRLASKAEAYLLHLIGSPSKLGFGDRVVLCLLSVLSGLYGFGLGLYLWAERVGLRSRYVSPVPVVSIGNMSVGGTGKTPITARVCSELKSRGFRVVILSRGHGAALSGSRAISDRAGSILFTAEQAGDEPYLLAKSVPGVPVVIGKDRRESVKLAMSLFQTDVFVMDDGLQYWQMARDLDVVLLDTRSPFDNGHPLPRGLLREPVKNVKRAGIVLLTRWNLASESQRSNTRTRIGELLPDVPIFTSVHAPTSIERLGSTDSVPVSLELLQGQRVYAVSGIGQPGSFEESLKTLGAVVTGSYAAGDHHQYTQEDLTRIADAANAGGANIVVTTAKDGVKWQNGWFDPSLSYYVLHIRAEIAEFDHLLNAITGMIEARKSA